MTSTLLTVYIPTFSRDRRLERSLRALFREIVDGGLESDIAILVGDNASFDDTLLVCKNEQQNAKLIGIEFDHFRNQENLGFGGNIAAGILRVSSDWVLLLSDDDNLIPGALAKVCADIKAIQPSVSIYNFSQAPFDFDNPLITQEDFSLQNSDYTLLTSLILWPKMSGVVFRVAPMFSKMSEIKEICLFSSHFPHVILSFYLFRSAPGLFKSSTFFAEPDKDYLDHVNFVPYMDHYLVQEIEAYRKRYDSDSPSLSILIKQMARTNILDASMDALVGYYRGQVRLTESMKRKLTSNLLRFLSGKKETADGLCFSRPSGRFFLKLLALPALVMFRKLLSRFLGQRALLMEEGF
jgi:glycosyltransferase involved in cell wall biosynthesis